MIKSIAVTNIQKTAQRVVRNVVVQASHKCLKIKTNRKSEPAVLQIDPKNGYELMKCRNNYSQN